MITNSDALKPCPFCGGKANIADNTSPKLCTSAHAYVFCLKRGCPGRGDEQETVDEAVAAWNNREAAEARARLEGAKAMQWPDQWPLGTRVRKRKGASWQGRVVGYYSTHLTPRGYAVESERETGSVQLYPEAAFEVIDPAQIVKDT